MRKSKFQYDAINDRSERFDEVVYKGNRVGVLLMGDPDGGIESSGNDGSLDLGYEDRIAIVEHGIEGVASLVRVTPPDHLPRSNLQPVRRDRLPG